ncbi:MAG: S9 family peptidase, partial [Pseudomonadota bacterium]
MLRIACSVVLLSLSIAVAAEPFTAEHLVTLDRVGAPVVSPDGTTVVYPVRHADLEADKGHYDLWMSPVDGGKARRLTTHVASDTSPSWSADGQSILFLSNRGDSTQVWRLPIDGGEAQPVTDLPLSVGSYRASPAGDRLVVSLSVYLDCDDLACTTERMAASADTTVSAKQYDQLFMRHWDYWMDDTRSQLFSIALDENGVASGEPVRVTLIDADVPSRVWGGNEEYAISPDGKSLFFAARLRDASEPASTNFDIYSTSLNKPTAPENLTADNQAWDTAPIVGPDGRYLAYKAMARPGFEADQYRIQLRDLKSGETRALAADWDRSPSSITFAPDGQSILAPAQDVGHKTLWRVGIDGSAPVKLIGGGSLGAFAATGDRIVYTMSTFTSPAELYALDLETDQTSQLTAFTAAAL